MREQALSFMRAPARAFPEFVKGLYGRHREPVLTCLCFGALCVLGVGGVCLGIG